SGPPEARQTTPGIPPIRSDSPVSRNPLMSSACASGPGGRVVIAQLTFRARALARLCRASCAERAGWGQPTRFARREAGRPGLAAALRGGRRPLAGALGGALSGGRGGALPRGPGGAFSSGRRRRIRRGRVQPLGQILAPGLTIPVLERVARDLPLDEEL